VIVLVLGDRRCGREREGHGQDVSATEGPHGFLLRWEGRRFCHERAFSGQRGPGAERGFGRITYDSGYADRSSSPTGFALAGGVSYDARITLWCAIRPVPKT
jgi:hypothetical protein